MHQMPEDMAYDPAVADLKAAIRELQPAFVDAHKAAEASRAATQCVACSNGPAFPCLRGWPGRMRVWRAQGAWPSTGAT
jgi:hypothetical protein